MREFKGLAIGDLVEVLPKVVEADCYDDKVKPGMVGKVIEIYDWDQYSIEVKLENTVRLHSFEQDELQLL